MSKTFWGVIAAIVIILVGVFAFTSKHDKTSSSSSSKSSSQPTSHVMGSTSTGVKLQEYGDYECPYCGRYYPIVKQVVDQYKDRIQFQFSNLPLSSIHRNAFAGARAAEAAGMQSKYWEFHDLLYENQDPQGASGWVASSNPLDEYFVGFARQAGVSDITKFRADFASREVNNAINADIAAFNKTGLQESTPTFFLDGKHIDPNYDIASFQKAIETEIKNKTGK